MKILKVLLLVAMGLLLAAAGTGCGKSLQQRIDAAKGASASEEFRAVGEADQEAQLEYLDEWDAFRAAAEKQIAVQEKKIEELKAKAASGDAALKARIKTEVEDYTQKTEALKTKLQGYQDEGKVGWDAFKRDFTHDIESLSKALRAADGK